MIFSERYAEKSYNIDIECSKESIDALYNNQDYDYSGKGDSAKNIVERYHDIEEPFPVELKDDDTIAQLSDQLMALTTRKKEIERRQ